MTLGCGCGWGGRCVCVGLGFGLAPSVAAFVPPFTVGELALFSIQACPCSWCCSVSQALWCAWLGEQDCYGGQGLIQVTLCMCPALHLWRLGASAAPPVWSLSQ